MESFLDKFASPYTKRTYKAVLDDIIKNIGAINKRNLKKIKEYIDALKLKPKSIQDKHFIIKSYLTHLGIKPYKFEDKPFAIQKKETLPTLKEIHEKLTSIDIKNVQDKLVLNLLFKYPVVLRTDLADVKLKDIDPSKPHYDNGKKKIVLNGSAGTGKTTCVNAIIDDFREKINKRGNIAILAPTNKAVQVLVEKNQPAYWKQFMTVHQALNLKMKIIINSNIIKLFVKSAKNLI